MTDRSVTAAADVTEPTRPARPSLGVFAVTAAGGLLVSLDVSIANALLPAIGRDFTDDSRAALSWVITGYAIVFAAVLVPAGRVADRAGRRRTYAGGLAVFALGSLVCGLAPSLGVLLAGRLLQGVGAAAASPASLALLLAHCSPRDRSSYAARWTGAAATGVCLGPLVGGALTDAGDWRLAFLVNLPVAAAVMVCAPRLLPETPRHPGRPLPDPLGAVVFALAAASVTLVLSEISTWGAGSPRSIGGLVAAVTLTVLFVRRATRVEEPLLDVALLRNRRVAAAAVVTCCYAAGFFGFLLTMMLFFVDRWHLGVVVAGAAVLPTGVVVIIATTHVGRAADQVGHRLLLAVGAAVMAATLLASAASLGGSGFEARWLVLGPVMGLGIGLCYPVLAGAAVHGLPAGDLAAASALNQCARQLGAAVGVAAAVGILGSTATPTLDRFHTAWVVGALFSAAAVAAASLIPRDSSSRRPRQDAGAPTSPPTIEELPCGPQPWSTR
jgi:EmrB/QacA subfamily drug resistance transporter